jgi:hypothetical protein
MFAHRTPVDSLLESQQDAKGTDQDTHSTFVALGGADINA